MNLEEGTEIYNNNQQYFIDKAPDFAWKEDGFNLTEAINNTKGMFLEVAGPTPIRYKQIEDFSKINKQLTVSNITPGVKLYNPFTGEYVGTTGSVDLRADATLLPLEDSSVGALLVSCLPVEPAKNAIKEMQRVVENKGVVVWEGGSEKIMKTLLENGFALKSYQQMNFENGSVYNFVCQKN